MKARIINTPVEVEVQPYFPEGMFAGFTDVSGSLQPGMVVYKTSDLEFIDKPEPLKPTVDWSAFRREAAKDILAGMLSAPARISIGGKRLETLPDFAKAAVKLADELIKQLKMEEEE